MSWFEKELNYARGRYDDDDGDTYEVEPRGGRSLTGRLWDYMGPSNWGWSSRSKDDPEEQSRDTIQKEVAGTVNLLNNSTDGNEQSLRLGFASRDGAQANDISSDTVIMPADIVAQTGSEEAAIDVMSGMALIASTMKTTVDFHANEAARASTPKDKGGHYLWTALEQAIARRVVSDKWPGFDSYFDSHRDHCTTVEGSDIDAMLEKDKADEVKGGVRIGTALVTAAYNTLNPRDAKLIDDERMRKVMNLIADLALAGEAPDRFSKSCNIAEFIKRVFEKDEDEEEEEEGRGEEEEKENNAGQGKGDEGEGKGEDKEGEEEGEDKGEDGGDPYEGLPVQADDTLFGKPMEAGHNKEEPKPLDELMLPKINTSCGGPEFIRIRDYKADYTKSRRLAYKKIVADQKGEIKAVVNSLLFMNNHPESHIHGMLNGTLDPGSLHKLSITDMDEPRVFEQVENVTGKKIAVSLLIDRSGSMGIERMDEANCAAIILVEALSKIDGIDLNVHSHTTCETGDGDLKRVIPTGHTGTRSNDMLIHDIIADGKDSRQVLAKLKSGWNNLDGYAIKHIGERMAKDYSDHDEKIIFVISDGQPRAASYSGHEALVHVGDNAEFCRMVHKVKVFGIGIDDAFSWEEGKVMYGEGNFIVLSDVKSSIKVMASFLRNVAVKQ